MVQTIVTASHISVQGEFVRKLADGRVMIRVGETLHIGMPVNTNFENPRSDMGVEAHV